MRILVLLSQDGNEASARTAVHWYVTYDNEMPFSRDVRHFLCVVGCLLLYPLLFMHSFAVVLPEPPGNAAVQVCAVGYPTSVFNSDAGVGVAAFHITRRSVFGFDWYFLCRRGLEKNGYVYSTRRFCGDFAQIAPVTSWCSRSVCASRGGVPELPVCSARFRAYFFYSTVSPCRFDRSI